jgi:hypothetical protein
MSRAGRAATAVIPLVLAAVVLPLVAIVCGLGWLYLFHVHHVLAAGPDIPRALALKQLALVDAQPLVRVIGAWALSGLGTGLALAVVARKRPGRTVAAFVTGMTLLLIVTGAASDALANNELVARHLSAQISRPALWIALAAVLACAVAGMLAARGALRHRRPVAQGPRQAPAAQALSNRS